MYTNRTKELLEIDENFNLEKAQIKITYQNDYDSIKKREENEIKNLLDKKIIEKTRINLLNLLDNN